MTENTNRNLAADDQRVPDAAVEERDDPGAAPGTEGLPEYADDETPENRAIDDPQRQPVPGEHPLALDEYGTTAAEARHGEPLAGRLVREEPDVSADDVPSEARYERGLREEGGNADAVGQAGDDADALGNPGAEDPALNATFEGDEPHTGSPVSVYDRMDRAASTDERSGQLVAPDEGTHPDRETDAIASDSGGSVTSAEENAMHDDGPGR